MPAKLPRGVGGAPGALGHWHALAGRSVSVTPRLKKAVERGTRRVCADGVEDFRKEGLKLRITCTVRFVTS